MSDISVKIFQIFYRENQKDSLDPAFTPFDNTGIEDPRLEYGVFERLHNSEETKDADYWGAFSWKFGQKTHMKGSELIQTIADHPGYDVYYSNYSPEIECLFQNMWIHGQTTHPGFIRLAQAVFRKSGIDPSICHQVECADNFAASNFFVATPAFWTSYISFVESVMHPAMEDPELRLLLLSHQADPQSLHVGACYIPFIIERLFGVFLNTAEGRSFTRKKYSLPSLKPLSPHHTLLFQMKEAAWKARSAWLMGCWYGYRNLFLESIRGEPWARTHLIDISPKNIWFADPYES